MKGFPGISRRDNTDSKDDELKRRPFVINLGPRDRTQEMIAAYSDVNDLLFKGNPVKNR